jgi:hypothetical protein
MGMGQIVTDSVSYKQVSASGNVWSGAVALRGIFVSAATTTPTITIYDDPGTGTTKTLVSVFTPVAGTFYPLPFLAQKGLNVVISGTVSCTVGFDPQTL